MHDNHDTHELAEARRPEIVELADGDEFDLEIAAVAKRIGDATVRMLAYNGSIPGPTLRLPQGATVTVHATNHADVETTVHWHGLRLDNRFDGTHHTQPPIPVGGTFTYRVHVPDPGAYWYHPHIREDYGQELGLYGNVLVAPSEPDYWPPANRELLLTLDDILIEDGRVAAFGAETTHVAMGRFGNVMLVGGDPTLSLEAGRGEVVRLYLTNTANTRVFNVMLPGVRMKLVGADSGHYEREEFVDAVLLAPSERAVVDVLLSTEGEFELEHRTPERSYRLASITVEDEPPEHSFADTFPLLRTNRDMAGLRERIEPFFAAPPDKTVTFVAELDMGHGGHAHHHHHHGHHAHAHGAAGGIEWEDEMAEMNRVTTTANTTWKLVDRETGAANAEIDWTFKVGDQVKLRLINEPDSDHPMPHPFHIHGAGRFVVLARDGVVETNLVWKDTVLVRTGETLDILLDVTNPGRWMAHCHIAEHHESGMMFSFDVTA